MATGGQEDNDIIVLLVGQTGHGKSATGNSILRRDAFKSKLSPESVTDRIQRKIGTWNGRRIDIVDTPGFADTEDKDIEKLLTEAVFQTLPGFNAVLFVLRPDRFTNELVKTVTSIFNFFGNTVNKFAFVLFTHTKSEDKMNEYLEGIDDAVSGNLLTLKDLLYKCENKKLFIDNAKKAEKKNIMVNDIICSIDTNVKRLGQQYFTNIMYMNMPILVDWLQHKEKTDILQNKTTVKKNQESHNKHRRKLPSVPTDKDFKQSESDDTTSNDGTRYTSYRDMSLSKAAILTIDCSIHTDEQTIDCRIKTDELTRDCSIQTDEQDYPISPEDLCFNYISDLKQTIAEEDLDTISEDDQIDENSLKSIDDQFVTNLLHRRSPRNSSIDDINHTSDAESVSSFKSSGSVPSRKYDSFKRKVHKNPGFFIRAYVAFGKWLKRVFRRKTH